MKKLLILVLTSAFVASCNMEEETMEAWDLDLSGDVSKDEFYERWYEAGYWNLWDRNNDGIIDEEEWNMGLDEYYNSFNNVTYDFSDFDLDGDEKLSEEELADATLTIWDTDRDGNIDKAEFTEHAYSPDNPR